MTWLLYSVVAWFAIGLIAVAVCLYTEYNPAEDFTLEDFGMVVATICIGPIFAVWYIKESAADIVLIKGRVQDERGRTD